MSDSSFLGSGWSFPPTFEIGNYQLNMTHKEHNINQSIDLILQTQQGVRNVKNCISTLSKNRLSFVKIRKDN